MAQDPSKSDDDDMTQSEMVTTYGEVVAYCSWNGGAPGYSGITQIYAYEGQFWVYDDGQLRGPFASQDEAEDAFPYFQSIDEESEEDSAIMEIWDKSRGMIFQRQAAVPATRSNDRANTVWVIDNAFVSEPWLGGMQLGELPNYDLAGKTVVHLTQDEFDQMQEEFKDENGYYPDT